MQGAKDELAGNCGNRLNIQRAISASPCAEPDELLTGGRRGYPFAEVVRTRTSFAVICSAGLDVKTHFRGPDRILRTASQRNQRMILEHSRSTRQRLSGFTRDREPVTCTPAIEQLAAGRQSSAGGRP